VNHYFTTSISENTRTVYVNDVPSGAPGAGALLDAILQIDRSLKDAPPPPGTRSRKGEAEPHAGKNSHSKHEGQDNTTTACERLSQAMAKVMRP
jgi:hypothetical protein